MSDKQYQDEQDQYVDESSESLELEQVSSTEQENNSNVSDDTVKSEAKKFGHISKEEWVAQGRDPAAYKTEEDFVQYGKTYNELQALRKKNERIEKQLEMLVDYKKQDVLRTVQQAKKQLESELRQAKEINDVDAVERLTAQKVKMDFDASTEAQNEMLQAQAQANREFEERNKYWYNDSNPDLKIEAQSHATRIMQLYPEKSVFEVAQMVEKRMKYEHPELDVTAKSRVTRSSAESNVARSSSDHATKQSDSGSIKALSPDQQAEFNVTRDILSKSGIKYTVKDYQEGLKRGNL